MEGWRDRMRLVAWELYMITLGLVALLILLIALIFFIPTLIWRPIAKALRSYLRPDLGEILSCTSSVFAQVDDTNYAKSIIVLQAIFKGTLDYDLLVKRTQEKWINCKNEDNNLRYPELQQYITNWVGYKFWKWEDDFNVRNHIHLVKPNGVKTANDIHTIRKDLLCGSFEQGKSPWDFTLIPDVVVDGELSSILLLRVHHALADGYSLLFLIQRLFGVDNPHPLIHQRRMSIGLGYVVRLPYKVLRTFGELVHNTASSFLWKIPEAQKSRDWSFTIEKKIPITTVIKIKRHFGVSFSAVVFALLCGGLQRFIAKHEKKRGIVSVPSVVTVPVKSHPDKLCNKFSFAMISYPVGILDPVERLKTIHHNFEGLKDSPIPVLGYLVLNLHGSHFNFVGKLINSYRYAPCVTSYFPVGQPNWSLQSCPLQQTTFYLRLQQGQQGAMLCISSIHDHLNFNPIFNASLLSTSEVNELSGHIEDEARILIDEIKTSEKKLL